MGALFGGGGTNTRNVIRYSDLQVSTSQLDIPVTLFWGQRRISPNCIWYNNFQSHASSSGGKGSGKGGGGKSGPTQYTYTAAVILALGEGVMSSPLNVWGPSSTTTTTTLSALGMSFVSGTASQTPWSYVTTNYPGQALSYMDTAYVASPNLNLGSSASVPDYAFEMQRLMGFTNTLTAAGWTNPTSHANTAGTDCSFADIIPDFLTSTIYGMGFAGGDLADMTSFRAYQSAQGLYFSPCLTSQEKATDILDRWAQLANSWIYWNGTQIEFLPLGDSAVSGNGYSFTPDLTAAYNLQLSDLLGDVPVEVDRQDPADCYNRTVLEICDRTRGYVSSPVEYKDQYLVAKYGVRDDSSTQADEICNPAVGAVAVQLIGKRAAYIRNTYKFKTSYRYIRLLPGSIVTLTEPNIGLFEFPVRIRTIDEDEDGVLSFLAEELPAGIGTYFATNTPPATTATTVSTNVDPGAVNPPAVCEPASTYAQGQSVLLIAASGGANWGGCNVFVSLDGTDFTPAGEITATALQGTLTAALAAYSGANPDTTDTLSVDATQSRGTFPNVGAAAAQNYASLCWISPQPSSSGGDEVLSAAGELLAFGAAAATGTYTANLTYLERGLYGTSGEAHGVGDQFTLFDLSGNLGSTIQFPLPPQYIGQTVYLKLQSFNIFGHAAQDLSTCTTYAYVPSGASFGAGSAGTPTEPASLTGIVQSSQVILSWSANPATDNVNSYALYRAAGTSAPFSAASLIWAGLATSFTDTNVNLVTGYTYYVVAINAVGDSLPGAGFNASTAGVNNGQVLQAGSFSGVAEATIDFNPQVLACTTLEITLSDVVGASGGNQFRANLRVAGADVSTTYKWAYIAGGPVSSTAQVFYNTSDTSINLNNALSPTAGDQALGFIRVTLSQSSLVMKMLYEWVGDTAVEFQTGRGGARLSTDLSAAPTGMSFFSTGDTISFKYSIKGY